jgi:glycosyltransferase involved in cell wall biosynthesis
MVDPDGLALLSAELQHRLEEVAAIRSAIASLEAQLRSLEEQSARPMAEEMRSSLSGGLQRRVEVLEDSRRAVPALDLSLEGAQRLERLLRILQSTIEDVANDNRDIHDQIAALVSTVEHATPAVGTGPIRGTVVAISGTPFDGIERRLFSLEARVRLLERPLATVSFRGAHWLQRRTVSALRFANRALGGAARRVVGRAKRALGRGTSSRDEIHLTVRERPPIGAPALSIFLPTDRFSAAELALLREALGKQTIRDREWVLWNGQTGSYSIEEDEGASRRDGTARTLAELKAAARGKYFVSGGSRSAALPLSWWETGAWLMGGEDLAFVWLDPGDTDIASPQGDTEQSAGLFLVRKDLWEPDKGLHLDALVSFAKAARDPILGKRVRHVGRPSARPLPFPEQHLQAYRAAVRRVGDYFVPAAARPQAFPHDICGVAGLFPELLPPDHRTTVLALLPFLAVGGAEKLTLDVMTRLAEKIRFLVVTLAPHDPVLGNRVDDFRRVTPYVYTLGESFPPQLFFSLISLLLRKYRVHTLFNANGTTWFYDALPELRAAFPGLTIVNQLFDHREGWIEHVSYQVAANVDVHIATNQPIERTLIEERGVPSSRVALIHHGIELEEFRPSDYAPERLDKLRDDLGIPREALLVTMAVRMHPQKRPEDFVALARRFREDPEFFFLLVGGGTLEGVVDDLIAYGATRNVKRIGFYERFADLLAVTDIACLTSEYEALPLVLLSALAMETPVVATAVGCIEEVLSEGPCGIVIPRVGDLEAFERAIRSLRDPVRRQEMGRAGRRLVERKFDAERAAQDYERALLATREAPS